MKFETETGSLYEHDEENFAIRRLIGVADPTPRQGNDGEWRTYKSLSSIEIGKSVVIVWNMEVESDLYVAKCTTTSPVKAIFEGNSCQ